MFTTDRPIPKRRPAARGAFTLIELMVSMSILSIVMAALMSTMLISLRSLPDADNAGLLATQADAALEMLMADAMLAITVAGDESGIKILVPDRDNDGTDEIIFYGLSTPDSTPTAFVRVINGGTPRVLVRRARAFNFSIVSTGDTPSLLVAELITGHGIVHRAAVEIVARRGVE